MAKAPCEAVSAACYEGSLEDLQMTVEGSPEVVALVRDRLGIGAENEEEEKEDTGEMPRVFLSYTSDDIELARRLAESLQANGIDTWWDRWCTSVPALPRSAPLRRT